MCFDAKTSPPMDKSLYKGTLEFLKKGYPKPPEGKHLTRLQQYASMIVSCFRTKQCTVEGLSGTCPDRSAADKNCLLQNAKRFLKNKWVDYDAFFLPLAISVLNRLAASGELVFMIDGSQVGGHTVLTVSVLWKGMALPIIWLLRKGEKGHFPEDMHVGLLRSLTGMVPQGCRCVLLGDGEFDGADLRALCRENGWEFVLRTQKNRRVTVDGEEVRADSIYPAVPSETQVLAEDAVDGINLVCWHSPKYEEPIYLLTNMELGQMACTYYALRFQIENMFKRMKSHGYNIHKTAIACTERLNRMLMVAFAAYILLSEMGRYLKEKCSPSELAHIVCKDRIPKMTEIRLIWAALKEDAMLVFKLFPDMTKNFCWSFP